MKRALLVAAALAAMAGAAQALNRPDPNVQAVADGCGRASEEARLVGRSPQWVYVNDREAPAGGPPPPPQWGHGIVHSRYESFLASHPAASDLPTNHFSYDLVFNLLPDSSSSFLLAGDPGAGTGNFEGRSEKTGRVHTEWEQGAFPLFAWPEPGDRVSVLGSWVWDCDHWLPGGERTELHPLRAIWVYRNPGGPSPRSPFGESEGDLLISTDKTPAGTQADCAHRTKGDTAAFRACLRSDSNWQDVNGKYRFYLPAPRKPAPGSRLAFRVVDAGSLRGAPRVRVRPARSGVSVAVDVAAPAGRRVVLAKRILVGWRPMPARLLPEHLRLSFRRLLVRRAMDPGCPTENPNCPAKDQSTRLGSVSKPPGEWNVYWDVAGIWSMWSPRVLRPLDGQVFAGRQVVDFYLGRRASWRLLVFARECDLGAFGNARGEQFPLRPCPAHFEVSRGNDAPGIVVDRYRSPAASLGLHRSNATSFDESTCPRSNRRGCYGLTYEVTLVEDAARRAAATQRR